MHCGSRPFLSGAELLVSDIKSLNLDIPLKYLVAAHAHADHVMGLAALHQLKPGLLLMGSQKTAAILGNENIVSKFIQEDMAYEKYLSSSGIAISNHEQVSAGSVTLDQEVDRNSLLDLGDVQLKFIDAPGHAPGHMVVHVKPDNVFLISDAAGYASAKDDILPLFFHHFRHYLESLHAIKTAEPDYIGLGHNLFISGKKESLGFLENAIQATNSSKEQILGDLNKKTPAEKIESTLSAKMMHHGLFKSFAKETLMGFSKLLIRRVIETG